METIKVAFESCLEEDNLLTKTLKFVDPEEKEIGSVTITQLTRKQILDLKDKPIETMVVASIETWTFTDSKGKPLEVTVENLERLTSRKRIEKSYQIGIFNHLVDEVVEFNFVTPVTEKNSERQSSSDS